FIKNIFEEFSWRGYLTPKLIELKLNDWFIYIISGLVWALWHAAYYLVFLPNEYFESISRLHMLLSGCILMVSWSIMYVEIYRLTKSVWPCVIMHAIEDAVPTVLVTITGIITLTKGSDFIRNVFEESVQIMRVLGAPVKGNIAEEHMKTIDKISYGMKSSMQRDMEKGSFIEGKHLQGYLLDVAEQFSIAAPLLGTIYQNLKVYEE
ncbi:ketopantoate reductase C-terminal domain-containing protein, partial [Bacillus sp. D-CC]